MTFYSKIGYKIKLYRIISIAGGEFIGKAKGKESEKTTELNHSHYVTTYHTYAHSNFISKWKSWMLLVRNWASCE
ncbi:unnamed protein product [Allacma fusca]|uniref:Uncharacterized protein n=1 Tax=Allacma fusca TaxID=39272 RepID=A0A8J2NVU2_9HEXA|nr:unnamed protein product [Allacma fusca]